MKNNSKIIMVFASAALLASCGGGKPAPDAPDASEIINGFSKELTGTVQFTYTAKYDVTVDNKALSNFEHNIDDVTTGEYDLTAGNLYLHVVRNGKDKGVASKAEALVYKAESDYFYLTNVMENPTKLASEEAARAKIDEFLVKISHNNAGDISTSTALYGDANSYFHREFGLSTGNIAADEFLDAEPTAKVEGTGVQFDATSSYVGYNTDSGVSDFPGIDGKSAGVYTVNTNASGYVTSYTEAIHAQLAMPITIPAPVVSIAGTRAYSATYGQAIEKKSTIDHQLTKGTVSIPSPDNAIVEVFTTPTIGGEKTAVTNGAEVVVGQYLAIKVTPAGSNKIVRVTLGTTSLEKPSDDGFFYFEIKEGVNKVGVNISGSDKNPDVKVGTYTLPEGTGCEFEVKTCAAGDWGHMVKADPNNLVVGNILAVKITAPEGKTVATVKCNGNTAVPNGQPMMGFWCFSIVEGVNAVTVEFAA